MLNTELTDETAKRTEEIQDIIDKMPTSFGVYVTYIILFVVGLLLFFGWIVRYPDVVTGVFTVNTETASIKLISASNGKLKLNDIKSQQEVKENQILAWIDNSANPADIQWVKNTVQTIDLQTDDASNIYKVLPRNKPLGELTAAYTEFLQALKSLGDFQSNKLIQKQISTVNELLAQEANSLRVIQQQKENSLNTVSIGDKFYSRDSILYSNKVLSASEFDHSKLAKITTNNQHQEILKELSATYEKISGTKQTVKELEIQKIETERAAILRLTTAKNTIFAQIKDWENRYLLKSPFAGRIQFLRFWNNDEFVQSGEALFTIVPHNTKMIGQVILPSKGAGKVKVGQEVIIKLDNYPYMEYGSVRGFVSDISLTTNTQATTTGAIETYLVSVKLPSKLKTNYGSILDFKNEIKGSAEIITKDRRFIERFFENLKYGASK